MTATIMKLDLGQLLGDTRKKLAQVEKDKKSAKAQKHQSAREKARRKELRIGEYEPTRQATLKDIMKALDEARQWQPEAVVLYVQRQFCQCGEEHKNVVGLFVRSRSLTTGAHKLSPTNGLVSIDLYPREYKIVDLQIPACQVCFKAQDLVDLVFNGVHAQQSGQLPLFLSLL